jgi:hypothetical protein
MLFGRFEGKDHQNRIMADSNAQFDSNNYQYYFSDFIRNSNGFLSDAVVQEVMEKAGFGFPADYTEVMKAYNGGEGSIGKNAWLILYPIEDLIQVNTDYGVLMEQIPDYFLFGKDAADTGFAFHKQYGTYHAFGLMSDFKADNIDYCGNSFFEFVRYLYCSE